MKNYVYIYYNKGTREGLPEGQVHEEYSAWFANLKDKLVDGGNPFKSGGKAVSKEGVMDIKEMPATGYSIVKANSLDEALQWAKDCPILKEPQGAVCVYETMPM